MTLFLWEGLSVCNHHWIMPVGATSPLLDKLSDRLGSRPPSGQTRPGSGYERPGSSLSQGGSSLERPGSGYDSAKYGRDGLGKASYSSRDSFALKQDGLTSSFNRDVYGRGQDPSSSSTRDVASRESRASVSFSRTPKAQDHRTADLGQERKDHRDRLNTRERNNLQEHLDHRSERGDHRSSLASISSVDRGKCALHA